MSKFATPITEWLTHQQVDFNLLVQPRPATSIVDAAQLRGIKPQQMIKAILLRDMDDQFTLACVPGDQTVDPKKVRALLQWKRMTCVASQDVEAITGYPIGAVAPLLLKHPMPIIFDLSTQNEPWVTISSGDRSVGIALKIEDLIHLCKPRMGQIIKDTFSNQS